MTHSSHIYLPSLSIPSENDRKKDVFVYNLILKTSIGEKNTSYNKLYKCTIIGAMSMKEKMNNIITSLLFYVRFHTYIFNRRVSRGKTKLLSITTALSADSSSSLMILWQWP